MVTWTMLAALTSMSTMERVPATSYVSMSNFLQTLFTGHDETMGAQWDGSVSLPTMPRPLHCG